MMLNSLDAVIQAAKSGASGVVAVAAAHDTAVIEAVAAARREGIVTPILVGHEADIRAMLSAAGEDPTVYEIVPADSDVDCAKAAVQLVTDGKAHFLMKGILGTADLMRAVLAKEANLRTDSLLSHVMLFETPGYHKMILMSDGGMNTFPDLEKKVQILDNAAGVLHKLGYDRIHAACVCGAETVNPKIQSTVDAYELTQMTDKWEKYHMNVIGPVSVDLALSKDACAHKRFDAPGAGDADLLLVTNYEMGNAIYKTALCLTGCRAAGLIIGAKVPIILVSRSDSADSKLASIALGTVIARS
ncbi:MAG: phosphate butyryltransferase [Clostridia bacterium]|nr:phosphate butyryltransferase [Clostridia bacterium]